MQDNLDTIRRNNNFSNTDRNIASNNNLPSFDIEESSSRNYENNEPLVPTPPPELREKMHHHRLYDIEEEYLSEFKAGEDLNFLKEKKPLKQKKVYVNLKDYNHLIVTIKQSRNNFKAFTEKFNRIENIDNTNQIELSNSQKLLEIMQRKLIGLDNRLFEKSEDEYYD